jgi:hypothetical protein
VLASRVFPDGDRKDVGRYTIGSLAFSIPAGSRLDCRSSPLAPTGHCKCSAFAAQEVRAIPGLVMDALADFVGAF